MKYRTWLGLNRGLTMSQTSTEDQANQSGTKWARLISSPTTLGKFGICKGKLVLTLLPSKTLISILIWSLVRFPPSKTRGTSTNEQWVCISPSIVFTFRFVAFLRYNLLRFSCIILCCLTSLFVLQSNVIKRLWFWLVEVFKKINSLISYNMVCG